jgi:hypothetical protein
MTENVVLEILRGIQTDIAVSRRTWRNCAGRAIFTPGRSISSHKIPG